MMKLYLNSSLVFFRIFDSGVDGFTLVFSKEGELIHALNSDGTEFIKSFIQGATLTETRKQLDRDHKVSGKELEIFIKTLVSKKILQYEEPKSLPTWIDPSDVSTLLTRDARDFSALFSQYLSNVFHDNTSLIDSHKDFMPHLTKFFPAFSEKYLSIDIGCGNGYYSDALKEKNAEVISTDLSFERLHTFKNRLMRNGDTAGLAVVSNAECLPFKENQFDFILCIFVLEHVMDICQVIKEMSRIARPGARLIISFPSLSLKETIMFLLRLRKPVLNFKHFHTFGFLSSRIPWCRNMNRFLRDLGAENIDIKHIEGTNLLRFNSQNIFMKGISRIIDKTMGKVFPFNRFGEQTIIIGRKK
jgi:2-polyprenyl-3-methyl-5-hydroxy-6-metoxy-1,4-benzoquinol methylase